MTTNKLQVATIWPVALVDYQEGVAGRNQTVREAGSYLHGRLPDLFMLPFPKLIFAPL